MGLLDQKLAAKMLTSVNGVDVNSDQSTSTLQQIMATLKGMPTAFSLVPITGALLSVIGNMQQD
jgi:hypothetical protein